jgi:hypothetical protein
MCDIFDLSGYCEAFLRVEELLRQAAWMAGNCYILVVNSDRNLVFKRSSPFSSIKSNRLNELHVCAYSPLYNTWNVKNEMQGKKMFTLCMQERSDKSCLFWSMMRCTDVAIGEIIRLDYQTHKLFQSLRSMIK